MTDPTEPDEVVERLKDLRDLADTYEFSQRAIDTLTQAADALTEARERRERCGCRSQAECLPYAKGDPHCRYDELPPEGTPMPEQSPEPAYSDVEREEERCAAVTFRWPDERQRLPRFNEEMTPASELDSLRTENERLEAEFGHLRGQPIIYGSEARKAASAGADAEKYRAALERAADDLGKAANQFQGIHNSNVAGHSIAIANNARIFTEKEAEARSILSEIDPASDTQARGEG